ncbi:MAG: orotidine-5'-phosphate decarboxylase [Chloroflexi bacterium]|nr:orotidine-5'-phosphate decarboxylase [Chloroflexota bacterium]
MTFWEKLVDSIKARSSLLCVGLDPVVERIPRRYESVAAFNRAVVDATAPFACAYKPNIAFYEALGQQGLDALRETMAYIPQDIPVILDAKRNDIASTAQAYARAVFEIWGADAVTVTPYLGADGVVPFLQYEDRGVFLLCKTSNPSAGEIQDWSQAGLPLYRRVADLALRWSAGREVGLVMGATYPEAIAEIRRRSPQTWFLIPGVGAQGGDLEAVLRAGLRADGLGVLINASRSVLYAQDPGEAARELRDLIRTTQQALGGENTSTGTPHPYIELCRGLYDAGCVRFGDFTLHSGAWSPVYIDLRLLVSRPELLQQVAGVYARLLRGLTYERIAAVPYAALPIGTAVSLLTGDPLIYPRREVKAYGTRRAVEGEFRPGERALLLDDLISSGGSKLEAIAALEAEGLVVKDVVVLIDREQGGRQDLEAHGYRLHAALTLRGLAETLAEDGRLSGEQARKVIDYLEQGGG